MDSALNSAHQQSRRADSLERSGKIEEAILCHRRAAEYLLQALQITSCDKAKESISLQHQLHLKQQDILQQRHLRIERYTLQKNYSKGDHENKSTQTDQGIDQSSHFTDMYHMLGHREKTNDAESSVTYREKGQSIVKVPRDDETLLEELSIQNAELRKQVSQLVKDLEECRNEKDYFMQKLLNSNKSEDITKGLFQKSMNEEDDMKMPVFDLPPLEMPHFDFDSLPVDVSVNVPPHRNIFPTSD